MSPVLWFTDSHHVVDQAVFDGSVSESLFGFHTYVASLILHRRRLRIKRIFLFQPIGNNVAFHTRAEKHFESYYVFYALIQDNDVREDDYSLD